MTHRWHWLAAAICGVCVWSADVVAQSEGSAPAEPAAPAPCACSTPPLTVGSLDASCPKCQASDQFYGGFEATIWWLKGVRLPVLATSDNQLASVPPGSLTSSNTIVLIGGNNPSTQEHLGGQFLIGMWLEPEKIWGIEASYFFLAQRSHDASANSPGGGFGTPTVFRPFFDVGAGMENALFVAGPGVAGGVNVNVLQRLQGADENVRFSLCRTPNLSVDLLAGFRFLALDENLDIDSASIDPLGVFPTMLSAESFSTRNRFYGGQLGTEAKYTVGPWSFDVLAKVALGAMDQTANVNGTGAAIDPATGTVLASGPATLFAQTTNIGKYTRDQFCVVPQLDMTAGYDITSNLTFTIGYSLLYASAVARPGEAIDRNTTVPTIGAPPASATSPGFNLRGTDFWAQGIRLGLAYHF